MRKIVTMLATTMMFSMTATAMEGASVEAATVDTTVHELQYSAEHGMMQDQYYNFGRVRVGRTAWANFTLRNNDWSPMVIRNIRMNGYDFAQANNCPRVLRPRERCTFQISFTPSQQGPSRGALVLRTTDGRIRLQLAGQGVGRDRGDW